MIIELIFIAGLVFLDQWTKLLTLSHLKGGEDIQLIDGIIKLTYVENTGAAFGMFQNGTTILAFFVVIITLLMLFYKQRIPRNRHFFPAHMLLNLIIAGAIGNLIDRIRLGFVVDMIHFYWFEFPVFNIADIYVSVSATILALLMLTLYKDFEL